VVELCSLCNKLIEEYTNAQYKKLKPSNKGIAFPTCISVNNCVGHFSPLPEDGQFVLSQGDLVKVDLGVHFDGYVSQAAHTIICGHTGPVQTAVQGRMADVICAAYFASECAIRLLRPGKTNADITKAIEEVAAVFNCRPVEGVLSHQLKRNIIDCNNVIISKPDIDQAVDTFEFQMNQVYAIDILMSTGQGKTRETTHRTTVFKRNLEHSYSLKLQTSRQVFAEIIRVSPCFLFTLRSLDERKRKLGIVELLKHNLLHSYPVLFEKDGELVAQFKFTALILPNSTERLNSNPPPYVTSAYSIDSSPSLKAILAMSTKRKRNKKKGGNTNTMQDVGGNEEDDQGQMDVDEQE